MSKDKLSFHVEKFLPVENDIGDLSFFSLCGGGGGRKKANLIKGE